MSYASILVHVDWGPDVDNRVKLASGLATRLESHLIGLGTEAENVSVVYAGGIAVVAPAKDLDQEARDLRVLEETFRRAASTGKSIEWRGFVGPPLAALAEQARAADLLVMSRLGLTDPGDWRFSILPGDALMCAGRPVLVVPPGVKQLQLKRAVVAWKDTREARRALRDALPLLKLADKVFVLAIADGAAAEPVDVANYLHRHAIAAEPMARRLPGVDDAEVILEVLEDRRADLVVAGAYGHSRVREWAFGGVTRELLERTPVCCLMAH